MRGMLPIIGDTWRQSRQQVIFIIMFVVLMFFAIGFGLLATTHDTPGGEQFGIILNDGPSDHYVDKWTLEYAMNELAAKDEKVFSGDAVFGGSMNLELFTEEGVAALEKAETEAARMSHVEVSVQAWSSTTAWWLFSIALLGFIAACSGYFPGLMASGAVDVVVAKPLRRSTIFFGKYLGGLALLAFALLVAFSAFYVTVGLRTGAWPHRVFLVLPLTLFCAALLYAVLGLIGVLFRNAGLAMILGYVFYLLIDTAIGFGQSLQRVGALEEIEWLDTTLEISRSVLPNFQLMKDTAIGSVMSIPYHDWQTIGVGAAWLVVCLGLGVWKFRRTDF